MLVISKRFHIFILHEFGGSDIDEDFGGVSHLEIVVFAADFDGKKRLFVELDGCGQVVVLA